MPRLAFDEDRLAAAERRLQRWVADGLFPAAAAVIGSADGEAWSFAAGRQAEQDASRQVDTRSIFLIASPTKPIVALAIMKLVEQGELRLTDPAARYLPEFGEHGKDAICIEHLLTHTSGLPDMVPENLALRQAGAPLEEFYRHLCRLRPGFKPGTNVSYQSTGFLVLGELVRKIAGKSLPTLLQDEVFRPLEMHDTALGMPPEWAPADGAGPSASAGASLSRAERIVYIPPHGDAAAYASTWNSDYWRRLGAPWGGLLSTAPDLARLCGHLLQVYSGREGILQPATLRVMASNRLATMPDVPEPFRRASPWALGWQLHCPSEPMGFGDLTSLATFGHWGATGSVVWLDPLQNVFLVLLTTRPLGDPPLVRGPNLWGQFSNLAVASLASQSRNTRMGFL